MPYLLSTQHPYLYRMAENLNITTSTDKSEQYQSLIPQIAALLSGEPDLVAQPCQYLRSPQGAV